MICGALIVKFTGVADGVEIAHEDCRAIVPAVLADECSELAVLVCAARRVSAFKMGHIAVDEHDVAVGESMLNERPQGSFSGETVPESPLLKDRAVVVESDDGALNDRQPASKNQTTVDAEL